MVVGVLITKEHVWHGGALSTSVSCFFVKCILKYFILDDVIISVSVFIFRIALASV